MSEHTKGPWKVSGAWISGPHGEPICNTPPASLMASSIIEQEANAALISSAPDLLEALEGCRDGLIAVHSDLNAKQQVGASMLIDIADAALKKAKP